MAADRLLLSNGTSFLLLSDGVSRLLLSTTSPDAAVEANPIRRTLAEGAATVFAEAAPLAYRDGATSIAFQEA